MSLRELFGGAIIARIPDNLIDASELPNSPPVPDTQELLLYPNYDISVIIDILQGVENQDLDPARFHFDALAHDNSALDAKVESVSIVEEEKSDPSIRKSLTLVGTQYVQRQRDAAPDEVRIAMGVIQIRKQISEQEEICNDLVITFNVPIKSAGEEGWTTANRDFKALAASLQITDYGLFVPRSST